MSGLTFMAPPPVGNNSLLFSTLVSCGPIFSSPWAQPDFSQSRQLGLSGQCSRGYLGCHPEGQPSLGLDRQRRRREHGMVGRESRRQSQP